MKEAFRESHGRRVDMRIQMLAGTLTIQELGSLGAEPFATDFDPQ